MPMQAADDEQGLARQSGGSSLSILRDLALLYLLLKHVLLLTAPLQCEATATVGSATTLMCPGRSSWQ